MTKIIFKVIQWMLFATLLLLHHIGFAQFMIPPKPSDQTSVYDYANILSASEKNSLKQKLLNYADSTSTQIVIISIEDLKNEDIGILTPKWAHEWGIGQEKEDNGVLILVAKNDRKIWISPGYGLEPQLTAGINGDIIRNIIIPEFKAGSYYNGLDKGTDAIFEVIKGTYKNTNSRNSGSIFPIIIFIIIVIIIILLSRRNRNGGGNGGRYSGSDLTDMIILSRMGRSGGFGSGSFGSGGGFGGGGFGGGFGGGGFSGGGAGGSW
ncbi:TPM domain-containing protein [Flavobacterium sp. NRK F10]|uniref:TPM domain-containing protein n=1 Tax=Flavobacterium sp. NRK F10 TaxID=2954931 RepID=UPI0020916FB1|nr:TPM domain-containing protein [Flavobacterium sp. NRK F10]MCO6175425.1 TPM domain-containing protein [Flavobacterium sp. NRK F10]